MNAAPSPESQRDCEANQAAVARLRALLVVSRITFVPENYDALVCGMADCPQVAGLVILDNRSIRLIGKSLGLLAVGARQMGRILLMNCLGRSNRRRRLAYANAGKPVWLLPTINCQAALEIVRDHRINLIVNARTRYIYQHTILTAPRLGCINVHHGLLPDQRGTMCDLWALYQQRPAGFTIHQMSEKVDSGGIIRRVETSGGDGRPVGRDIRYAEYLRRSTEMETAALREVLAEIEGAMTASGNDNPAVLHTQPNECTESTHMYRNPTAVQLRAMMRQGLKL